MTEQKRGLTTEDGVRKKEDGEQKTDDCGLRLV